jgi:hypothetical protein
MEERRLVIAALLGSLSIREDRGPLWDTPVLVEILSYVVMLLRLLIADHVF